MFVFFLSSLRVFVQSTKYGGRVLRKASWQRSISGMPLRRRDEEEVEGGGNGERTSVEGKRLSAAAVVDSGVSLFPRLLCSNSSSKIWRKNGNEKPRPASRCVCVHNEKQEGGKKIPNAASHPSSKPH